jgi:hypothetical protein
MSHLRFTLRPAFARTWYRTKAPSTLAAAGIRKQVATNHGGK